MEDKHLDTILEIESEELIKYSVEDLVHTPSESDGISESECDVPDCDDSQTTNFSTFSNPLFDDSTSSDDERSHEEVIHEISFKTYLNPLFDIDEEIISSEFNPIHNEDLDSTLKNDRFDTESYLLESVLNRDTLMASSPKIDSSLIEFVRELITIPPRMLIKAREYIRLLEMLLYIIHPPYRQKIFMKVDDNRPPFPSFESFHCCISRFGEIQPLMWWKTSFYDLKFWATHPTLHMDFDFIPSHNDLESDLDVSSLSGDRNKIYDPGICIEVESTRFLATHSPMIDTLLPFSSENKDKVFNHGVLASKEKSPHSSSHRGFKASKLFHQKSLMLIYGEDIPILDVPFLHFYPP
ncbi:hypothetical protein Tco_0975233 [Tanacetum coccineum]|uniref:Maturase K n=1 Tax=Tanacetum coccineum TaxID=301880 RepID=A0ABQ5EE09_9ASTR